MTFYAVARGKKPGVYQTWSECQEQVSGFPAARFKKFATASQAEQFIAENSSATKPDNRKQQERSQSASNTSRLVK